MVRLTVALKAPPHKEQELVNAFRFLTRATMLEPGCLGCSAWMDPDATVHYLEEWSTEADMERRVRSDRFTSVLALLESAREPPRVRFDFVTTSRGLDYVNEVRDVAPK